MLELNNIGYEYPTKVLFEGVTAFVEKGQILHIKGDNGAGKTTLLKIIAGLKTTQQGEIKFANRSIAHNKRTYQQQLAYLGHQELFCAGLTVRENCYYNLPHAASAQQIEEALSSVGLSHGAELIAEHLSAGQKRRLSFARLPLLNKTLWVLDEPFTALDKAMQDTVCQWLVCHCSQGNSVVMTSHHAIPITEIPIQHLELS